MTLDGGQARPIKLEVAKELFKLLKTSSTNVNTARRKSGSNEAFKDSDSETSSCQFDFQSSSSTDDINEIGDYKPSDLPQCLMELGSYLDNLADATSNEVSKKKDGRSQMIFFF